MRSFKIVTATADGKPVTSKFQAADAAAAIKLARLYIPGGYKVELWEGETLLSTLPPEKHAGFGRAN